MGKITKERPHGFKTETEAWNEDTKDLEFVEEELKKEIKTTNYMGLEIDNNFDLLSKVLAVHDRSSLCYNEKYIERMSYCQKLMNKISKRKK